jgi:hypothetical protein
MDMRFGMWNVRSLYRVGAVSPNLQEDIEQGAEKDVWTEEG